MVVEFGREIAAAAIALALRKQRSMNGVPEGLDFSTLPIEMQIAALQEQGLLPLFDRPALMRPPARYTAVAGPAPQQPVVGQWLRVLEDRLTGRARILVAVRGTVAGNLYYSSQEMPTATEGLQIQSVGGTGGVFVDERPVHNGPVYVNPDTVGLVFSVVEWVYV